MLTLLRSGDSNMNRSIPAKLHLGDKTLISDMIPAGTAEIGDWAYACCSCLKWLAIPCSIRRIGRDAFSGCTALKQVFFYSAEAFNAAGLPAGKDSAADISAQLNAAAVLNFPDPLPALIRSESCSDTELNTWDEKCLMYLAAADDSGFAPFLAGGEEDYSDHDEQLKQYIKERQLQKARIIYMRLLSEATAGFEIGPEFKQKYLDCLRSDPEAVTLLNDIDSHFTQAAEIYAKAGLLNAEALPVILDRLSPDRIEIRSALICGARGSVLGSLAL